MLGWWIYHKLARAEKHIDEVEADIARFLADRPYGLTNDFTPNADGTVTWTRRAKIEPQGWVGGSIAFPIGDAIHNMRAALDYLAMDLWGHNGRSPTTSHVEFPIYIHRKPARRLRSWLPLRLTAPGVA